MKDLGLMLLLVVVLFYISHNDKEQSAFHASQTLTNTLIEELNEITTADELWTWTEEILLPILYPSFWYNGWKMKYLDRQFPLYTESFRLGPPLLTQDNEWIDNYTDYVVLDLSLYYPSLKLFSSLRLTVQQEDIGHLSTSATVATHRLFQYENDSDYVMYHSASAALDKLVEATGELGIDHFVDLSSTFWWDDTFKTVLAIVVFITTLTLLRVVRFSKTIASFIALPRAMKNDLIGFSFSSEPSQGKYELEAMSPSTSSDIKEEVENLLKAHKEDTARYEEIQNESKRRAAVMLKRKMAERRIKTQAKPDEKQAISQCVQEMMEQHAADKKRLEQQQGMNRRLFQSKLRQKMALRRMQKK
ncbi:Hypp7267 [Branchiostoma lanceolatum]|uniref:Hypp7267 protein n=1 Tax=Branchiostoma lanceolatum TaxID=7740 RepID=A0A8J9YZ76_BRALA|nr:Hypp7267 [Branchiostoma lanceolatum]